MCKMEEKLLLLAYGCEMRLNSKKTAKVSSMTLYAPKKMLW